MSLTAPKPWSPTSQVQSTQPNVRENKAEHEHHTFEVTPAVRIRRTSGQYVDRTQCPHTATDLLPVLKLVEVSSGSKSNTEEEKAPNPVTKMTPERTIRRRKDQFALFDPDSINQVLTEGITNMQHHLGYNLESERGLDCSEKMAHNYVNSLKGLVCN